MKNKEIRNRAKASGVKLWQVAEGLGMSDSTFSRKLRKELSEEQKTAVVRIIDKLSKEIQ